MKNIDDVLLEEDTANKIRTIMEDAVTLAQQFGVAQTVVSIDQTLETPGIAVRGSSFTMTANGQRLRIAVEKVYD